MVSSMVSFVSPLCPKVVYVVRRRPTFFIIFTASVICCTVRFFFMLSSTSWLALSIPIDTGCAPAFFIFHSRSSLTVSALTLHEKVISIFSLTILSKSSSAQSISAVNSPSKKRSSFTPRDCRRCSSSRQLSWDLIRTCPPLGCPPFLRLRYLEPIQWVHMFIQPRGKLVADMGDLS